MKINSHLSVVIVWIALVIGVAVLILNVNDSFLNSQLSGLLLIPVVLMIYIPIVAVAFAMGIAVTIHIYSSNKKNKTDNTKQ